MAEQDMERRGHATFESIKRHSQGSGEYWLARELAPVLEYQDYRNFLSVIEKARMACAQAGLAQPDHFGDVTRMVEVGSGARREISDVQLSRYACYLPAPETSIKQLERKKAKALKGKADED